MKKFGGGGATGAAQGSSQNSSISQALRNFDNAIKCALTNSVITLKNKYMLIYLFCT